VSGVPFVGASGKELDRMLVEAGLDPADALFANVCNYRPPNNDISEWIVKRKTPPGPLWNLHNGYWVHPNVFEGLGDLYQLPDAPIICFGNTPLWAKLNRTGITSWRGSQFPSGYFPTFHPAAILRQWSWRPIALRDLRRFKGWMDDGFPDGPSRTFSIPLSADHTLRYLAELEAQGGPVAVDIETRGGQIACIGFAPSGTEAFCVPFINFQRHENSHWSHREEQEIIFRIVCLLSNPDVLVLGHNFSYDIQYLGRQWGLWPRVAFDTIVAQHLLYPGMQKSLAFISSMYSDHYIFWKDDGKNWDPKEPPEQLWQYNCMDCMRTFECYEKLAPMLTKAKLLSQFDFQMNHLYPQVNKMNLRGVKVDTKVKGVQSLQVLDLIAKADAELSTILGESLNVRSPVQTKELFYDRFGFKPRRSKHTGNIAVDDAALASFAEEEPLVKCVTDRVSALRSANVYLSTFLNARLDNDGRFRSNLSTVGTETFRFSSSENPYGIGLNLQNLPKEEVEIYTGFILPNIREFFIPDAGYLLLDIDLERADAQVVAAEAGDEALLALFASGADIHAENAKAIGCTRQEAKTGVHAVNYGVSARTLARALRVSTKAAEQFITRWFLAHPLIERWHDKVAAQLKQTRTVYNRLGYRKIYTDRLDNLLPQALAWIPQSTVACVINRALVNIGERLPEVELLIQVHDSLVLQFRGGPNEDNVVKAIKECFRIPVPYNPPLIIGCGIQGSTQSWGNLTKLPF